MMISNGKQNLRAYDFRSMLEASAMRFDEKDYLVYKRGGGLESLSFIGFAERVKALSESFLELGLGGEPVAIIGETAPEWIIAYFATIICGGVVVPLDKELSKDAIVGFINKVGCRAVVYSSKCKSFFENEKDFPTVEYLIGFDGENMPEKCSDRPSSGRCAFNHFLDYGRRLSEEGICRFDSIPVDLEKCCAILFTSGTTGSSKGVMLSQKNLIHAVNGSCLCTEFDETDTVVSILPIHHTYEMTCGILTPLLLGATVCINDSLKYIVRNLQLFKPTGLVLVPLFVTTIYKRIWDTAKKKGRDKLLRGSIGLSEKLRKVKIDPGKLLFREVQATFGGRLKRIICGGAPMPMPADLIGDFAAFGVQLCQGYGITECAPLISVCPEYDNRPGSVGPAIPGLTVKIDVESEEDGKLIGEIMVQGPSVMKGYFMDKEATDEVLSGAWFRTGDYGYLDEDGYIYITGRKKNVIVLNNGKNVFPEEIEEYLEKIDLISECVVIGRKNDQGDIAVTAVIYPDFEKTEQMGYGRDLNEISKKLKELIGELNRSLPSFKQIRGVELRRTEFEKTTSKKIIRHIIK